MKDPAKTGAPTTPARIPATSVAGFIGYLVVAALVIWSLTGTELSLGQLVRGLPEMGRLIGEMFPPATDRMASIGFTLFETFQMAIAGTFFGVLISLPLAVLSARNLAPHPSIYLGTRGLITFCRTVPDLIWAIIFVITVGLGPFAGVLALTVDTVGFCARFFAEAMEEADEGPPEALRALGASRTDIVVSAVLPATLPSLIATSLYAFEKSTRSSVVLGLVGAGGIGVELMTALDLYDYRNVSSILLSIFVMVILVERFSAYLRKRIL
jgi:phosphonate transport system permease protein